jgi:ABC-type multidrug transport system ATPase subunit
VTELELLKAGRRYNRNWIFRNLDLQLIEDSSLAILGPNGSGKSTLIQLLAGYLSPSEGTISLRKNGKEIDSSQIYRYISLAAPYIELLEEFSFQEQLAFNLSLKGSFGGYSEEYLIDRSGLKKAGNRPIKQFSSGMKQRVKLLLACSADTAIVLLDEPLTNLDQQGLLWYQELVRDFARGRTIVVASNNLAEYSFCEHRLSIEDYKNC